LKSKSLFAQLLIIFFGAGAAIVLSIYLSFHYLADKPYRKSFYRNIVTYTSLIADKVRFDPLARLKIESNSGIKIFSTPIAMRRILKKYHLKFARISPHVSITEPGADFFVKYDDGFDMFIIKVKDQNYHPEKIDAIIIALLIAALIILFTYYRVQKIFSPIKDIQKYTIQYGNGNFDEQIPVGSSGSQLDQLTDSINHMAQRIKSMLDAKRDLMLAIGHEIKTPLARLRLQTEMCDDANPNMVKNINEITKILDDLLEAERVVDHKNLNLEKIELIGFLKCYQGDKVSFKSNVNRLDASIDPVRLDLACKNVINNSLKYAEESSIDITLNSHEDNYELSFRDYGQGVSEDKKDKLTDAFYRPDEARTRDKGGVGLGLHLVKNVIKAHRGSLHFKNVEPGFLVTFTLPHQKIDSLPHSNKPE